MKQKPKALEGTDFSLTPAKPEGGGKVETHEISTQIHPGRKEGTQDWWERKFKIQRKKGESVLKGGKSSGVRRDSNRIDGLTTNSRGWTSGGAVVGWPEAGDKMYFPSRIKGLLGGGGGGGGGVLEKKWKKLFTLSPAPEESGKS